MGRRSVTWRIASRRREREGMDAGIGAKATSWTAWGAMAKASAHRCKRDMAWSEDAGRERTKAWMQASRRRCIPGSLNRMSGSTLAGRMRANLERLTA